MVHETYESLDVFMNNRSNLLKDDLDFSKNLYVSLIGIPIEHRGKGLAPIILEYLKYKFTDTQTSTVMDSLAFTQFDENTKFIE